MMNMQSKWMLGIGAMIAMIAMQACDIGYESIGDEAGEDDGEGENGLESGMGLETEDGSTAGSDETDDGVACTLPGQYAELSVSLTLEGSLAVSPVDHYEACTIGPELAGVGHTIDCAEGTLWIDFEAMPAAELPFETGAPVHLRLVTNIDQWTATWLRIDFVDADTTLTFIDGPTLEPANPGVVPGHLGVASEGICGAFADSCGERQHEVVFVSGDGFELAAAQGGDPLAAAYDGLADQSVELWVRSAWRYEVHSEPCQWAEQVYRLLLITRDFLAPGETCSPEADACGPGLACCYPCGIEGCEFVCQTEDAATMGCMPPPP